jgi:hypothetical protein
MKYDLSRVYGPNALPEERSRAVYSNINATYTDLAEDLGKSSETKTSRSRPKVKVIAEADSKNRDLSQQNNKPEYD